MFLAATTTILIAIDHKFLIIVSMIWVYYAYLSYQYSGFVGKKFRSYQYIALIFIFIVLISLTIAMMKNISHQIASIRDLRMIFIPLFLDFFASFMVAAFLNSIFAKQLDARHVAG